MTTMATVHQGLTPRLAFLYFHGSRNRCPKAATVDHTPGNNSKKHMHTASYWLLARKSCHRVYYPPCKTILGLVEAAEIPLPCT